MKSPKTSRREFLNKAILTGAALPFLPALKPNSAYAAANVAPLRLLMIMTPFEFSEPFYHPQVSATNTALAGNGSSFYIPANSSLAPLAPFQNNLILFRGLKYGQLDNAHLLIRTAFTGGKVNATSGAASGSSIDQYLFSRMAQSGSSSPFLAGCYSYLFQSSSFDDDIAFNNGRALAQTGNPLNLYNALFSNFTPPGSAGSAASIATLNRRQQILGLAQNYLNNILGRLPSSSSSFTALQTHLKAASGLNTQLAAASNAPACTVPVKSSINNDSGADNGTLSSNQFLNDFTSFSQVMTQAFACDLTRFGAYKMANSGLTSYFVKQIPNLGFTGSDFHADISHGCSGSATNPNDIMMAKFKAFFMSQVAALLTSLKNTKDPLSSTGQSLYDNTVVLIGNEGPVCTNGSDVHSNADLNSDQPFIVAGGCGGYFTMGRMLIAGGSKMANVNHNALLTNIINTFEKNQQQYNPNFVPNYLTSYGDYSFTVSPTSWLA